MDTLVNFLRNLPLGLGLALLATTWGCDAPSAPEEATGSINLRAQLPERGLAPAAKVAVTWANIRITGIGMTPIDTLISPVGGRISTRLDGIPIGQRTVYLGFLAQSNTPLWEGRTQVRVDKGTIAQAALTLETIGDEPPQIAAVEVLPNTGVTGSPISFRAQVEDMHDASDNLEVRWDFNGDGRFDVAWTRVKEAEFTFLREGTYQARIEVRDQTSNTTSMERAIFVAAPNTAPTPSFGQIAFDSRREGNLDIFLLDAGGTLFNLTQSPADDGNPSWSPDGSRIAFESNRNGNIEIFIIGADGNNLVNLTRDPDHNHWDPSWSPDGSRIAFETDRSGNLDIFLVDTDGSAPTNLTRSPGNDSDPAWSPDGNRIAFVSDRLGRANLFVAELGQTAPARLTQHLWDDGAPTWSPDGTRIAFESNRNGNIEIFVIQVDNGTPTNLTVHPDSDWGPSWSADGQHITFVSDRDGQLDIYSMKADGTGATRLVSESNIYDIFSIRP